MLWLAGIVLVIAAAVYAALELSPWPSALVYRWFMDRGGEGLNRALQKHVPEGIAAHRDRQYIAGRSNAVLDVYFPQSATRPLPTVVWVHGGGFLSGSKGQVANYLRILAARGYATVGVDYSLGPASHHPAPLREINAALDYLVQNATRLNIDPQRLFLAGDSAGAQLAAQLANVIAVPSYATAVGIAPSVKRQQLRGVILHCGVYDLGLARFGGLFGHFMRTIVWSYSGRKEFGEEACLPEFSIPRYVTADFPPAFISVGNGDALVPHSRALADALSKQGVTVDALFFPADLRPALPHEYQFHLDTDAGREALERTVRFLTTSA